MKSLRAPVIAGVAGGVGTTTVSAALHGHDIGRCGAGAEAEVDVLVCRWTGDSLRRAGALGGRLAAAGPRPVLAVTADAAVPADGPLHVRLRLIEPQFSHVVVLPHVGRWCEVTDPHVEAAALLAQPPEHIPRALRAYTGALRVLARAVCDCGRLERMTTPDAQPGRRTDSLWCGLHPVERVRPLPGDPPLRVLAAGSSQPDLDDEDLEAALAVPVRTAG